MPEAIGEGGYEGWFLTNGIAIYRSNYKFPKEISGQLIPLAKVSGQFAEPTLMIQTLLKGRVIHRDQLASNDLIYGDGVDLFRFCNEVSVTPIIDTSSEIEMISVMIGKASLSALIGEVLANQLIRNLGLNPMPKVVVRPIPSYVNSPLQNCLKSQYSPTLKKVLAQARVLDYLSELTKFICEDQDKKIPTSKQKNKRAQQVHQYLITLEGKLPTINSLAAQFGKSARVLNEEFEQEYGESIYNFIFNHRLNAAHEAIINSLVPLKQLAEKLGYAHVNHFSAAFRKKFGYSPGSLRKKY
ncbi:helix-turn-helix transcriptional regulator [Polynucleobacter sp. MWH-Spelu-300-X4]|uniref:helix-turn-helix transcriptional regulator n=1 Tax=Polynucleobacter sp. MWH-Spelu-300-X4 TaxID=2689109 RepID=UPI001BFCE0A8|nr:helix-turn-helix transcriptional regulator [Polynucleobacter sp. MWH-Spelu-300-X4]QWD79579.1 helix-turn-helix transcriptional regulator [Polynucleobacter sp. MWH-Spelu-300-X4]